MESGSNANGGDTMVNSLKDKVNKIPQLPSQHSICRVPIVLRKVNPEAYTPQVVSIGPFHHDSQMLQVMEDNKLRSLKYFLNREPGKTIKFYVETLRGLEERVRQCYEELFALTSEQFVEMMLLDSFFIIGLMIEKLEVSNNNDTAAFPSPQSWMDLACDDLLLIENQLPFFVMENLFNLINGPDNKFWDFSFHQLVLDFFSDKLNKDRKDFRTEPICQCKHFIDLLRQYYIPSSPRLKPNHNEDLKFIPSATELHEAGVKFEKGKNCFLDITFTGNGVLKIPPCIIEDSTELLFRNLMVFEHVYSHDRYVTDYATLMDGLISTPNDVAILRKYEIIDNLLGEDKEVSDLFNKLGKGTYISPARTFYYSHLCENVNTYYKKSWHLWMANLKRDYFSSPWSTLSFIAAVILLICTMIQTYCSVISLKSDLVSTSSILY